MLDDFVSYFVINDKTVFMPLRYIYPECFTLIEPHPQMYPVKCLREDGCPANIQCIDFLAKRVNYLFTTVFTPNAELLIAYYSYRDKPTSIRGAIFNRDLTEPRVITLNPFGFRKFQREGIVHQWYPTTEYKGISKADGIIPVGSLIRDS